MRLKKVDGSDNEFLLMAKDPPNSPATPEGESSKCRITLHDPNFDLEYMTKPRGITVCQQLASAIGAHNRCVESKNGQWEDHWFEVITNIINNHLPNGSGFDSGCQIELEQQKHNKLIIHSSYHAMNEHGMYDGWYNFRVVIVPDFTDFDFKVIGNFGKYAYNKEYIEDTFYHCLSEIIE